MELRHPCIITPRLMAGVPVGDGFISIELSGQTDKRGAPKYRYYIDTKQFEYEGDDLAGWFGHQDALATLMSFLSAGIEAKDYERRTGKESDNSDIFPAHVLEWAEQYAEEITMLDWELTELDLITE